MKKLKLISTSIIAISALTSCSNNASLSNDLNNTGDSIVRFVNGTFSAEIYNTSVQSVYNATLLTLNNNGIYTISNNTENDKSAEINGTYTVDKNFFNDSGKEKFNIQIINKQEGTVGIFIKLGKLGDKQASVDLLATIRSNLGM
ncbi:hypothetical protein LO80_07235 [Candidatus Francisella endociliophora]|uniref:DUF3568 domain-containing protein n=1 Tax=Candidatus Francisella endociliophora TaxID=653937 RepID=A0A097EQD5_9GAMM|nr:DUF3568 family protein [Francisella sp. FSC1006]AIT09780.1 hypothetical protein LO80_07235 [Francisella sp. FSC1006]